jgi:hypothetical protein
LFEAAWPIRNATNHHSHVNEVKLVSVRPWFLNIINLKLTIWGSTVRHQLQYSPPPYRPNKLTKGAVSDLDPHLEPLQTSASGYNLESEIVQAYLCFRMFIRCGQSTTRISYEAICECVPKSMAHIPVPVPRSSTRWIFWSSRIGEMYNFPPSVK